MVDSISFLFLAPSSRGGDDETDFARPTSTKVLQAKRVNSSTSGSSSTFRKSSLPAKSSSGMKEHTVIIIVDGLCL